MQSFAMVTVGGHLGADAEVRYTAKGAAMVSFSVASSYYKPSRDRESDEREERTMWYRVTWMGTRAENMAEKLTKGMAVVVTGRLQAEAYEARDNRECRVSLDVFATDCWIADRAEPREDGAAPRPAARQEPRQIREPVAASTTRRPPTAGDELDDLPFRSPRWLDEPWAFWRCP